VDLDQALFHAAFQIGVGQPQGDAEVVGQVPLGDVVVFVDGLKDLQGEGFFFLPGVYWVNRIDEAVQKMNIFLLFT